MEEKRGDFSIELGDILQIISPTNPDLHENAFYVLYVDSTKIKLVNINTYTLVQLNIDETGTITDESIREIHLLTRSADAGFARQNKLLPKTWVDIHFGGEIPYIATGEITNLEEDMIEIRTVENDVFYIDFEYKGLPEDIPIDKIVIRDPPANAIPADTDTQLADIARKGDTEATIDYTENGESVIHIPEGTLPDAIIEDVLHEIYLDANELYGEDLEEVFQMVEIPEHEKKYTLETQVNDFMDELLSTIPNSRRTSQVMSKIHNLVERFKELRNRFSIFDENGNVVGKKTYGEMYKPIIDHILRLDVRLRWLIPTVKQTKKLYIDVEKNEEVPEVMPNDTLILNFAEEMYSEFAINDNYYNNVSLGNQNKYDSLHSQLASFNTPFLPPSNEEGLLAFKEEVKQDMDAIVNHYTITHPTRRFKYMVQRYNLGTQRTSSTEMKNGVKVSVKTPLTPADKMSIESWFMMPQSVIKYSHIDLPATNIMIRSQLSQKHLDLFRIFHPSSKFAFQFIDNLEKELNTDKGEKEEIPFAKKITEYILDESLQNKDDKQRKLLDVIIPKTRTLIQWMQKYNPNCMSLVDVVSMLEPFMIYPDNLTYGDYNEIRYHIKQTIIEYKKNFAQKSKEFKGFVKKYNKDSPYNVVRNLITSMGGIDSDDIGRPEQIFLDHYYLPAKYTSSETLNVILQKDCSALFCNLLTYTLLSLITPNKLLDSFAEFDIPETKGDIVIREECATRVLAKKYKSIADLQKDNNGAAYWDKELDTTSYSILTKYSEEKEKMLPEKFITFLAENLVQKHDCPREKSVEMANTLIRGKRKVMDGEYAIVEFPQDEKKKDDSKNEEENISFVNNKYFHYYVRKDGQWVRDKNIDENSFLDTETLFCNASFKCFYDSKKDTCDSIKDTELRMKRIVQNNAKNEFDKKFAITVEELKSELEKNILSLSTLLKHKNVLAESILYKENNVAYNIGKYAVKHDMVQSPHVLLRDLILSQDDFIKRQQDICKFVMMFCREPIMENGEDIHWKYCENTNVKLFPASLYHLAAAFVAGDDYAAAQDYICNKVGQLSDDGDAIVDKHSGYVLRKIDFVNEETFDEAGFKITTHGLIEKDIGTIAAEVLLKKKDMDKVFENEMSQMIYNVFHSLCGNMGVDPVNHEDFVMRMATEFLNNKDIVLSQSAYEKRTEKLEKQKGKTSAPYDIYKNQILIACVGALTLVSIQSSLESVRPRKTFPGCVYSFGGYPLEGGIENVGGIKYVACVIGKTKSSIVPWNSVEKLTDGILAKRIRDFLETYVVPKTEVAEMLVRKREYQILHPEDSVPEEHNVSRKWKQFLPPLVPVEVSSGLHGTSKEFDDETLQLMRDGNKLQQTHYNVYKSKIIHHTYGIIELINENVRSKDVLMKTMSKIPYLENACCNDADLRLNPIQYFIGENKNIDLYVKRSAKSALFANKIQTLSEAPYLFNKEDTRIAYPEINGNFYEKEKHIYESIIHYCNFDTDLPIPDDLLIICREKPAGYDRTASLEEKIEFLKKSGKKYTPSDLSHMMRIVNARNIVELVPPKQVKPVAALLDFLENMEQSHSTVIEEPLRERLRAVLLEYNPNVMIHEKDTEMTPFTRATAQLRKYLNKTNAQMHEKIMEYIDSYGNLSNRDYNHIQDHILKLFQWKTDDNTSASLFQISGFFKNSIYNIAKLYPEMLLRTNKMHIFLPDTWNFSQKHIGDIRREIKAYHEEIQNFKNNTLLTTFMSHVNTWTNQIHMFAQLIPVQTPLVKNGEVFYGLFRKDTLYMLYMYCWYSVFYEYIQMSDDPDLLSIDVVYSKNARREKNIENIEEAKERMSVASLAEEDDDVSEYVQEIDDIVMGDKEQLKNMVCSFLITCIGIEQKDKVLIDKKYTDIVRSMKRTKEKEKQSIIRLLEDTENNDPKIEKMLKKHKLGRWNLGNQSSLFKYSKAAYDREREDISMLEQAEPENYEVEDLARMEQEDIDREYDAEGVDISGLDEEYYDGVYYPEDME